MSPHNAKSTRSSATKDSEDDLSLSTTRDENSRERQGSTDADRAPEHGRSQSAGGSGADRLQRRAGNQAIQRLASTGSAQTGSARSRSQQTAVPDEPGRPLPESVQSSFENRFGRDFGDVRIHTGPEADDAARALDASAFTTGRDIYFRSGAFDPDSPGGRRLLAHELAHTVQQRGVSEPALAAASDRVSHPGDALEREAERVATRVSGGERLRGLGVSAATRPVVARQVAETAPQGASAGSTDRDAAAGEKTPTPGANSVPLRGGDTFEPPQHVAEKFERKGKQVDVPVHVGSLASGTITVVRRNDGYRTRGRDWDFVPMSHPALANFPERVKPGVAVRIQGGTVEGTAGAMVGKKLVPNPNRITNYIENHPEVMGWAGMDRVNFPKAKSTLRGETLTLDVENLKFRLGGYLSVTKGNLHLENENLSVDAAGKLKVKQLDDSEVAVTRTPEGDLSVDGTVGATVGPVSGTVQASYADGVVNVRGDVKYTSEKISGTVTLVVTDRATARNIASEALGPDALKPAGEQAGGGAGGGAEAADGTAGGGAAAGAQPARAKPDTSPRAVAGYGTVEINYTEWLAGTATVVVDSEGNLTVVGKIAPPAEVELFPQKPFEYSLPTLRARAIYGVPVVGNVFVEASVGLVAFAHLGPATLKDIVLEGTYSTDPRVYENFGIQATLNISAFAGLRLRAEGKAGLTIVAHDLSIGVGIGATAGIRGYVEATPRVGYRELADPEAGKPGEFYIQGHMEIAAQPFFGLSGDLFVEVDAPLLSPISDKRWTWPIGSLEYPLPGEFGIAADFDHVLGSKEVPSIEFGEVDFDSTKFMTDLMKRKAPRGSGGEKQKKGTFKDTSPKKTGPPPVGEQSTADTGRVKKPPKKKGDRGRPRTDRPARGGQRGRDRRRSVPSEQTQKRWLRGLRAVEQLKQRKDATYTEAEINAALRSIKRKYRFRTLEPRAAGNTWTVIAGMNPTEKLTGIQREAEQAESGKADIWNAVQKQIRGDPEWRKVYTEGLTEKTLEEMLEKIQDQLIKKGIQVEKLDLGRAKDDMRFIRILTETKATQEILKKFTAAERMELGQEPRKKDTLARFRVTYDEDIFETERARRGERTPRGSTGEPISSGVQPGATAFPPAAGGQTFGLWNIGERGPKAINDKDNRRHAEYQLYQALNRSYVPLQKAAREIHLDISWSPCTECTRLLNAIYRDFEKSSMKGLERATLTFPELYPGKHLGTTKEDLKSLASHWTVHGPPILEKRAPKKGEERWVLSK